MTKTAKNREILKQLHELVVKQAAVKPVATGVPGKEPDSSSVSEKNDKVDQNAVKPENNGPQGHEQKASTDPAKPTGDKKAEDKLIDKDAAVTPEANASVEKLGQEILELLQKFADNPVATGIPGKEPSSASVSEKNDTVNQNAVKPENNTPQGYNQKPATGDAIPVATAKAAEEKAQADKVASYELGRLWGELVLKKAHEQEQEQIKEAGRRDFELLVAKAAAQLKESTGKQKTASVADQEKQAEAQGAAAFQELYKRAQVEQAVMQIVQQNEQLTAKLAEIQKAAADMEAAHQAALAQKQAELDRVAAEEREQQKFAQFASLIESRIIDRLRSEVIGR